MFGLGNKTYEHFNEMGRVVDKKLAKLGAERVYKLGEGDDDAKYDVHVHSVEPLYCGQTPLGVGTNLSFLISGVSLI